MGWLSSESGRATVGAAAVQTGSNALAAGINYFANKKLMQQQNDQQIAMWKMNNEYNDPKAQIDRLRAAGINPFTQEQGAGASSVPATTPNSANYTPFNMESATFDSQLGLLNTTEASAKADTDKIRVEIEEGKQNIALLQQYVSMTKAQTSLIENQHKWNDILNTWQDMLNDQELKNLKAEYTSQSLANAYYELAYPVMLAGLKEDVAIKFATEALTHLNMQATSQQIEEMKAQIHKIYVESASTSIQNEIMRRTKENQIKHIGNLQKSSKAQAEKDLWESEHMFYTQVVRPLMGSVLGLGGTLGSSFINK